eukprot:PhF_6_TR936/c0_g1_i1/m.1670/K16803/CKAP5, XMAP215; cytoskeleton-associated protein 5
MDTEFAEGPQDDFSSVPLNALLQDGNWKARKAGYDRLKTQIESGEITDTTDFLPMLVGFMKETNVATFEAAIESAYTVLTKVSDKYEAPEAVCLALSERGLVGRPKAAQVSVSFLSLLVEMGNGIPVIESLMKASTGKAPKLRMGAVQAIVKIVNEFGPFPGIPMKPLLKSVCGLCNDTDGKVRKEALNLCVEFYKFLGDGVKAFLSDLRDVQLAELEKEFQGVDRSSVQATRYVRGAAPKPGAAVPASQSLRDLHEMTPVIAKLPKNFFTVVNDKALKWQERNTMIQDSLVPLIKAPRLKAEDYTELTKCLRDLMTDSQLPLQPIGIKCIADISNGLGEAFAPYLRFVLPQLMDKFKEKKASVLEYLSQTLNAIVTRVCGLNELFDEFEGAATSKVPNQRVAAIQWATQVLETDCSEKNVGKLGNAVAFFTKILGDEKSEVREAAGQLLGALVKGAGERGLGEIAGRADTARSKAPASLNTKQLTSTTAEPGSKTNTARTAAHSNPTSPMKEKAPEPSSARVQKVTPRTGAAPSKGPTSNSNAASNPDDSVSFEMSHMSLEEITPKIATVFSDDVLTKLGSKDWQVRKETLEGMRTVVQSWSPEQAHTCCEWIVFLVRHVPGWKDSNAQVCVAMMGLLTQLCQTAGKLVPRAAYHMLGGPLSRFGDARSKPQIHETFFAVAECAGPKFVIRHLSYNIQQSMKNFKVSAEGVEFIEGCIKAFGPLAVGDGKVIAELCRACFDQANPTVKAAATKVAIAARLAGCANFVDQLGDTKAQIKSSLEAEIQKALQSAPASGPTRAVKADAPEANEVTTQVKAGGRVDVSSQLNAALLKQMSTATDWKDRMAAVKKVEEIIVAAGRSILPNGVGETLKALKGRLEEHNKNAVMDSIRTIAVVMEALGQGARVYAKQVAPCAVPLLADQKPQIRESATRVCEICALTGGIDALLPILPKAMISDVVLARQLIVEITVQCLEASSGTPLPSKTLQPIVPALLKVLMDRSLETRTAAEQLLKHVAANVGYDQLMKACTDLKPAEQQSLRPTLDKFKEAYVPSSAPPSTRDAPIRPQTSSTEFEQYSHVPVTTAYQPPAQSQPAPVSITPRCEEYVPPRLAVVPAQQQPASRAVERVEQAQPVVSSYGTAPQQQAPSAPQQRPQGMLSHSLNESCMLIANGDQGQAIQQCISWRDALEKAQDVPYLTTPGDIMKLFQAINQRTLTVLQYIPLQQVPIERFIACLQAYGSRKDVMQKLGTPQMVEILGSCLDLLLDNRIHADNSIVRAMNSLIMKFLENWDTTCCIEALMTRLALTTRLFLTTSTPQTHKPMELTVKCLLKVNKTIPQCRNLDTERILIALNDFLKSFVPSSFAGKDDLPLRTAKTVIAELTKIHGYELRDKCVRLFTDNSMLTQYVSQYVEKMASKPQENLKPMVSVPTVGTAIPKYVDPCAEQHSAPLSAVIPNVPRTSSGGVAGGISASDDLVANIFTRIRKIHYTDQGLVDLYAAMKQHPDIDIKPHFNKCSDAFQTYIVRKLKKLVDEDVAKKSISEDFMARIPVPREQMQPK